MSSHDDVCIREEFLNVLSTQVLRISYKKLDTINNGYCYIVQH